MENIKSIQGGERQQFGFDRTSYELMPPKYYSKKGLISYNKKAYFLVIFEIIGINFIRQLKSVQKCF